MFSIVTIVVKNILLVPLVEEVGRPFVFPSINATNDIGEGGPWNRRLSPWQLVERDTAPHHW